jgi:hypothetical protein
MSNEWIIFYFSFNLLIEVVNILIILSLLITHYLLLIIAFLALVRYTRRGTALPCPYTA